MRWIVQSPRYERVVPLLDDGSGPTEEGPDVLLVEAATRAAARWIAARVWLLDRLSWCSQNRADGCHPLSGLEVLDGSLCDPEDWPGAFVGDSGEVAQP